SVASFTRAIVYSLSQGSHWTIATPRELAVMEIQWSRDGRNLLTKLADRFRYSLWRINAEDSTSMQIPTFGWHVGSHFGSFAEVNDGLTVFAAESSAFNGRVILSGKGGERARTIYDANPQIEKLELGEQRRVTWRNGAD